MCYEIETIAKMIVFHLIHSYYRYSILMIFSFFFLFTVRILGCFSRLNWNLFENYVDPGNTFCACRTVERCIGDFNERKEIEFLIFLCNTKRIENDGNLYRIKHVCTFHIFYLRLSIRQQPIATCDANCVFFRYFWAYRCPEGKKYSSNTLDRETSDEKW